MISKEDLLAQFKKHKNLANSRLGEQRDSFRRCDAAYNADFANYSGTLDLTDRTGRTRSVMVQINKIKPYIMSIKGFFAQNRRKAEYIARVLDNDEQEAKSEYFNALADYSRDNGNADQIETQMDGDMLIRGLGAVDTDITYGDGLSARNPNGEIEWMRLDTCNVGWNPSARQSNLLDSNFVYYHLDYDIADAPTLFDEDADEFESVQDDNQQSLGPAIPGTAGGSYGPLREKLEASDADEHKVRVYFYQWYSVEKFYRAPNPLKLISDPFLGQIMMVKMAAIAEEQETNDLFSFDPSAEVITCDEDTRRKLIEAFDGVTIEFVSYKRRCYYKAILSGEKVFKIIKSPCQTGFSVKFKTGDWDESRKMWVGVVTQMVEPMLYYNKALTQLLFAIASGAKGGVMYEESAVDDVAAFEQSYARTDTATKVNDGGLAKIRPKREAYSPNGVEELIQISDASINDVAGIDRSFLGSSENKLETAALQRQRIKQVTTTLACYVDSIWLYQKENARLLIDLIRIYAENNDGSMFRVMDEETGKTTNQIITTSKLASDYDINITEGPQSSTEREERAVMLNNMANTMITAGDVATAKIIYATSIKYLPLDMADKQAIRKTLVPENGEFDPAYVKQLEEQLKALQSEQAQVNQLAIQSQAALNFAKVEEVQATVRNKNADSMKKVSETDENRAETDALIAFKAEELKLRRDELMSRQIAEETKLQLEMLKAQSTEISSRTKAQEDALAQAIEKMVGTLEQIKKPKRVVRDEQGNIVGVE
ncbi:hypothetical protein UFOVP826_63 [uncultured Caudovirales phage]|uniref:Phage P22-like portal protein n=1 Tax=uncultured Caudovirales phage TaxID=2100421 RepID=A0A6J5P035_9CAUD|nr:hypothetical protein UFOVP826_63 [uncultured Caudovirales phage]